VAIEIALKRDKSVAQVVLRFLAQENIVVIPKSANKERIEANIQVATLTIRLNNFKMYLPK